MYKKSIFLCFLCVILLTFTSCVKMDESMPEADETYEAIKVFFIPEGAEIVTDKKNLFIINSTQPFFELINFYENACRELNLQEVEINDAQDGIWIFSGIYHGFFIHQRGTGYENENENRERPLNIELRNKSDKVEIEIIY